MDPRKEIERFSKILEVDPHSQAFAPLAEAYRKLGEAEKGRRLCEEGLKKHPNYPTGRAIYGRILLDVKDYPNAKKELLRAVQLAPDNILALKNLARCQMLSGDLAQAAGLYEKVLSFNSEDVEAREFFKNHPPATPPAPPVGEEKERFAVVQAAQAFQQPVEPAAVPPAAPAPVPAAPEPIQTETLAGLYLQQGHPEKALAMLCGILVEKGAEAALLERIEEVWQQVKARHQGRGGTVEAAKANKVPAPLISPQAAAPPAVASPPPGKTGRLENLLRRIGERKRP